MSIRHLWISATDLNPASPGRGLAGVQRAARFWFLRKMAFGGKVSGQAFGARPPRRQGSTYRAWRKARLMALAHRYREHGQDDARRIRLAPVSTHGRAGRDRKGPDDRLRQRHCGDAPGAQRADHRASGYLGAFPPVSSSTSPAPCLQANSQGCIALWRVSKEQISPACARVRSISSRPLSMQCLR